MIKIRILVPLLACFSYRSNNANRNEIIKFSVCMKRCSSLVKMISDGVNNFMKNKCNKWSPDTMCLMTRYRNILPNHKKNTSLGSSTIYLLGVYMIEIGNSKLIIDESRQSIHTCNEVACIELLEYWFIGLIGLNRRFIHIYSMLLN